ncbi:MAG: Xaa-Pro peptidase family protein [Pseudomonadota bacterium]
MSNHHPELSLQNDNWSNLSLIEDVPKINQARLMAYRMQRLTEQMRLQNVSACVMVSPVSLRYAINYRNYALFTSHIPSTYLFLSTSGDYWLHGAFDPSLAAEKKRAGRHISFMYGGNALSDQADLFAQDIVEFLSHSGAQNSRVAVEYVNPSITSALLKHNIDVIDGVTITEQARLIKSDDELACIKWALKVAEHGADNMKKALNAGVSELQLWALLNYVNVANDGDWHDGRMLASGPRTNPWLQEASSRKVRNGDLVAFDTDMVGPFGYCADLSRTFLCPSNNATKRQKELYRLAMNEIEHNLTLVKHGVSFEDFRDQAFEVPEEYRENAYPCVLHGIGMCDEYPHIHPKFRGPLPYEGILQAGMCVCIESYVGEQQGEQGVKLEQQVLVTNDGYELLTNYPFEDALL